MKSRTGFVSNSSSSSFIVAYKKDDVELPNTPTLDMIKAIAGWTDLAPEDALEEGGENSQAKIQEYIDKGYAFASVSINYGGDELDLDSIKGLTVLTEGSY